MKKLIISIMALSLLLCACHKDDNELKDIILNAPQPQIEGMMIDAACITDMNVYCMDYNRYWMGDASIINSRYYYSYLKQNKEPLFPDYQTVGIYVAFHRAGNGLECDTTQSSRDIANLVSNWCCHKTDFIIEQYKHVNKEWPLFFTSYVNGRVQLTCDKVLFGQQPGENLSQHFKVTPPYYYLPVGREQPRVQYNFEDEEQLWSGIRMTDFFTKDSWMQFSYLIGFMEEPMERYDELTFTLTFPASVEHIREFCTSKYEGKNAPMRVTDTTFTASFKAKFNWNE